MSKFGAAIGGFFAGFSISELIHALRKRRARKTRAQLFRVDPTDIRQAKVGKTKGQWLEEKEEPVAEEKEEQLEMDIPEEEEKEEELDVYQDKTKKYLPRAPYAISDEQFFEQDGRDKVNLLMYSDGTIANEQGTEIDNPGRLIGNNILIQMESFGERCKHVRNEEFDTDYEIVRVDMPFYDEREDDDMK